MISVGSPSVRHSSSSASAIAGECLRVGSLVEVPLVAAAISSSWCCRVPSTPSTRRRRSPRPASVPTRWSSPSRPPRRAGPPPGAGRFPTCSHRRRTSRSPPRRSSRCRCPRVEPERRLGHSRQSCRRPACRCPSLRRQPFRRRCPRARRRSPPARVYIPAPVDVPPDGSAARSRRSPPPGRCRAGQPPAHRHRRPRRRPRRPTGSASTRSSRPSPSRVEPGRRHVVGGHAVRHVDRDDHRARALRQRQDSPPAGRALNRSTATPASNTAGGRWRRQPRRVAGPDGSARRARPAERARLRGAALPDGVRDRQRGHDEQPEQHGRPAEAHRPARTSRRTSGYGRRSGERRHQVVGGRHGRPGHAGPAHHLVHRGAALGDQRGVAPAERRRCRCRSPPGRRSRRPRRSPRRCRAARARSGRSPRSR